VSADPISPNELTVFRIIWKARLKISAATLIVGVIAGGVSLFLSNKYSATAAILVQQPELQVEGEAPPPNVETLRTLVEAESTKRELFERLQEEGILAPEMDFKSFGRKLSTEILHQRDREKTALPLIQLTAVTRDSELSALIANRWAAIVLEKTRSIHTAGVEELGQFIGTLFAQAEKSLKESETRYTEAYLSSEIEINRSIMENLTKTRQVAYSRYLDYTEELVQKKAILDVLTQTMAEDEINGIWRGKYYFEKLLTGDSAGFASQTEGRDELAILASNLYRSQVLLAEFEEKSNLQFKEMQLKNKDRELEHISTEIVQAQNRLAVIAPQYEGLQALLKTLSPTLLLKKAITDDALWNKFFSEGLPGNADLPVLAEEEINPVYSSLQGDLLNKSVEIKGLKEQIKFYDQKLKTLQEEVSLLAKEISSLQSTRKSYQDSIQRDQSLFDNLADRYSENRKTVNNTAFEVDRLLGLSRAQEEEVARIDGQLRELGQKILTWQDRLSALQRTVESRRQIRDSLAARAGEVDMLNVSLQDVSRSGIALLYSAQADPAKVGPHRVRLILAAMLVGFLATSAILVVSRLGRIS